MTRDVVTILNDLAGELGVPVVTPDYEIMLILLKERSLSPEALHARSCLSRSGFFHAIGRLKHRRCVEAETSAVDRRSRTYRLTPRTAQLVMNNLRSFRAAQLEHTLAPASPPSHLEAALAGLHLRDGEIRLPHLACEYQILAYLFFDPGAASIDIGRHVTSSETRFYAALRTLLDRQLIHIARGGDRRRKCYRLAPWVATAIDRVHRLAVEWVDEVERTCHPVADEAA